MKLKRETSINEVMKAIIAAPDFSPQKISSENIIRYVLLFRSNLGQIQKSQSNS